MSRQRSTAAAIPDRLFVGVPEAAELLGLDQRTVRRALEAGQVPGFKVGTSWRLSTAWLKAQAGPGGGSDAHPDEAVPA